ncbi:J domain-containing protein [Sporosarcina sp. CAU 1771]
MKFVDYYEVLQVSPTASFEVIKASFRQLSKMYHPDTFQQGDKKFILIKEAYDTLSDEHYRYEYDKLWSENNTRGNSNNIKEESTTAQNEFSNPKVNTEKKFFRSDNLFLVLLCILFGITFSLLFVGMMIYLFTATSNPIPRAQINSVSLASEEYSKIKTTERIFNHGDAYFEIYNGTNLTIKSIEIEINLMNDSGDIIETRQFKKSVHIAPLTVEKDIYIVTGIRDLPVIEDGSLRIQPKYISWSYIDIIGDKIQ